MLLPAKRRRPFGFEEEISHFMKAMAVPSGLEMDVSDFRARQKDQAHLVSINATVINWLFPRYDRAH
jgi:hypothetical protein